MIPVLSLTQVRISKFAVLFGDVVAFSVAFVIATFINVSIDDNQNIAVWFSTQDKERYATWFGLAFLGIMFFLMRFQHYSDRRPFWDELGDVLRLVSSLALLDMTLVATTRWNSSRLWWLIVWGWPCSPLSGVACSRVLFCSNGASGFVPPSSLDMAKTPLKLPLHCKARRAWALK